MRLYLPMQPFLDMAESLDLAEKHLIPAILKRKIKLKTVFSFPCNVSKSAKHRGKAGTGERP